ncbi:MAG: hypothetical protein HQK65_21045, partial [Desulfamplus sp.]|nr:hypothetical protein [Desulfamplus sp.]
MTSPKTLVGCRTVMGCIVVAMLMLAVEVNASTTKETKDSPLFASELSTSVASMNRFAEMEEDSLSFTMNADLPFCTVRETMDADSEACKSESEKAPRIFSTFDGFSGILTVPCLAIPGVEPFFGVFELYNWQEKKYKFRIDKYAPSPLDSEFCAKVDPDTLLVTLPFVKTGGATYYVELKLINVEELIFQAVVFNKRQNVPDHEDTMNPMDDRCEFPQTMNPMDFECDDIIPETMNPLECDDFAQTMNPMDFKCQLKETMNPMDPKCQLKETMNPMDKRCQLRQTMNPMDRDCDKEIKMTMDPMDRDCEIAQ